MNEDVKTTNEVPEVTQVNESLHITVSPARISPDENKIVQNYSYVTDFLNSERNVCFETKSNHLNFINKTEAPPLPSPEDKPWKQLPASLLNYNNVVSTNESFHSAVRNLKNSALTDSQEQDYINLESKDFTDSDSSKRADYVNIENNKNTDYVNTRNGFEEDTEDFYSIVNDDDIGVLGDIRFTGPCDGQLMSTSFSESNELGEEQGWDSGSDTRSSSSGEFIWKVS